MLRNLWRIVAIALFTLPALVFLTIGRDRTREMFVSIEKDV